jgi:hypothetical protein
MLIEMPNIYTFLNKTTATKHRIPTKRAIIGLQKTINAVTLLPEQLLRTCKTKQTTTENPGGKGSIMFSEREYQLRRRELRSQKEEMLNQVSPMVSMDIQLNPYTHVRLLFPAKPAEDR